MKILGPEARGSYGSVTVARNTYALYQRARAGGGGPGTTAAINVFPAWQALTDEQRSAWGSYALARGGVNSLGVSRPLTGFGAFCSCSLVAWHFSTLLTDPPGAPSWVLDGFSAAWGGVGDAFLTLNWLNDFSGSRLVVRSSGVVTPGTQSPPGRGLWWKMLAEVTGSGGGTVDLTPRWITVFGAIPLSGEFIFLDIREVSEWRFAPPFRLRIQRP